MKFFSTITVALLASTSLFAKGLNSFGQMELILSKLKSPNVTQHALASVRSIEFVTILKCLPGITVYDVKGSALVKGVYTPVDLDVEVGSCGGAADQFTIKSEKYDE